MDFPRQEYWSGLPFPFPGNIPNPGMECRSPALQTNSLPSEPPGKPVLHQLSLCCSLCSACLHSGFFHSLLPPSIPGFWLFFHPFFFFFTISSHINVLFITDYQLCTTSVEQFLSFSCELAAFCLRDGMLKAAFNLKYAFCNTNPVKWQSPLCSPAKATPTMGQSQGQRSSRCLPPLEFCGSGKRIFSSGH